MWKFLGWIVDRLFSERRPVTAVDFTEGQFASAGSDVVLVVSLRCRNERWYQRMLLTGCSSVRVRGEGDFARGLASREVVARFLRDTMGRGDIAEWLESWTDWDLPVVVIEGSRVRVL